VKACRNCPNHEHAGYFQKWYCNHENMWDVVLDSKEITDNVNLATIPSWCPLPDATAPKQEQTCQWKRGILKALGMRDAKRAMVLV